MEARHCAALSREGRRATALLMIALSLFASAAQTTIVSMNISNFFIRHLLPLAMTIFRRLVTIKRIYYLIRRLQCHFLMGTSNFFFCLRTYASSVLYVPFVPFKQLSAGRTPLFLVFSRRGIILNNLSFAFNGNVCNHELFLGATE